MYIYNEEIITKDYTQITVNQLAKHLNLDDDLIDVEFLESLIEAAVDWCEGRVNSYLVNTTTKLIIYNFSGTNIRIDKGNVNSISSIKVNGEVYTDGYKLIKHTNSATIILNTAVSSSEIEIEYKGGNNTKKNYLHAILIKAADFYDVERSDYSHGVNNNNVVMRLLNLM